MKLDRFIVVIIATIIISFCLGLLVCNGCGRGCGHVSSGHDTITVTIASVDTVYTEADTVWLDSIVYGTGNQQTQRVNFLKDDSIIYIQGFCTFHPPFCSLAYYVKPHQIILSWLDDSLSVNAIPEHYQVIEVTNNRVDHNRQGCFLYIGGGYNFSNKKLTPEIGLGYNFGTWGIKGGIINEFITAGIVYHF